MCFDRNGVPTIQFYFFGGGGGGLIKLTLMSECNRAIRINLTYVFKFL